MKNFRKNWKKMMYVLTPQQKKLGAVLLLMSFVGALFEMLGVSVIIPLMESMITPENLLKNRYALILINLFRVRSSAGIVILMCVFVSLIYLLKNLYLSFLSWVRARYASKVMRELSVNVMRSYMSRTYQFFLLTGKGDLYQGTQTDPSGVYSILYDAFRIAAEILTILCIFLYLFYTDPVMALSLLVLGSLCAVIMQAFFKPLMQKLGKKYRSYNTRVNKYMHQSYEGIKEILVTRRQNYFVRQYEESYAGYQNAFVGQTVASETPAYIIETVCVAGIIMALGTRINGMDNVTNYIPALSAFAFAAFRIMPSLGRITASGNNLIYFLPSLDAAYTNLHRMAEIREQLSSEADAACEKQVMRDRFCRSIEIDGITWKYENADKPVLDGLSLSIPRGRSIGIIGESGAGKSTLMDSILGLFRPQAGAIRIDGIDIRKVPEAWSRLIGYVPQSAYLMDDTVRNNVAFGIEAGSIDDEAVWAALRAARIDDFIRSLPDGLDTSIGDRGARLSGGQRQRIAIARALYLDPDILIFDEATSALDNETEAAVMESIDELHGTKTLIIVAHRLTTVADCDEIMEIAGGKAIRRDRAEVLGLQNEAADTED
ncbi:MAG: ABC transporter ATP-binding protein/permease [Lachnospiraceae bacterium]|jgi:ABC-type multidrug transport system fused ATPase/permease subunit|nr:ABC transporter ATP-binding protein/permease [Lachnospiraceae bacterium]